MLCAYTRPRRVLAPAHVAAGFAVCLGAGAGACLAPGLPAQREAHAKVAPSLEVPRGKVLEWTSPQGQPYWYRVPKDIAPERPANLLLMLHGTGLPFQWAFWNYPIASGEFRGNDVVVAPEGMTERAPGDRNFIQNKDNREQIAALIQLFKKELPIARVYLYGHSQGAFFCYWFAGEHPELVDGIVAHAGNLLGDVQHPKLAKRKVAIGILHGASDQVVPVECAHRTEKAYLDLGYAKVKKYIVEGLNEQAGHWPLPVQVGEMLDWLDRVTVATPEQALEATIALIGKRQPDLASIMATWRAAEPLLERHRGEDGEGLRQRAALVAEFVARVEQQLLASMLEHPEVRDARSAHGAWAAKFRAAHAALADREAWAAGLKPVVRRAAAHDKKIATALKRLAEPSRAAFKAGVKTLDDAFLGADYASLCAQLEQLASSRTPGLRDAELAELQQLVAARRDAEAAGESAFAALVAEVVQAFRTEHASVFPPP